MNFNWTCWLSWQGDSIIVTVKGEGHSWSTYADEAGSCGVTQLLERQNLSGEDLDTDELGHLLAVGDLDADDESDRPEQVRADALEQRGQVGADALEQ